MDYATIFMNYLTTVSRGELFHLHKCARESEDRARARTCTTTRTYVNTETVSRDVLSDVKREDSGGKIKDELLKDDDKRGCTRRRSIVTVSLRR